MKMKFTDLNQIYSEALAQLEGQEWAVLDYLSVENAAWAVSAIYQTNDLDKGFGQDFEGSISIISSRKRISVIANGTSSYYKQDAPLCEYESLPDDIAEILMVLETAIQRMETYGMPLPPE